MVAVGLGFCVVDRAFGVARLQCVSRPRPGKGVVVLLPRSSDTRKPQHMAFWTPCLLPCFKATRLAME